MVQVLRGELMQLVDQLNSELSGKHFKHVNKFETYTLQIDGKLQKIKTDLKKAIKLAEKVSI